jgi:hypothetical protein
MGIDFPNLVKRQRGDERTIWQPQPTRSRNVRIERDYSS